MAQLVRQHGDDFVVAQALKQSVEKHDAFAFAEAREIGIAMRGALRAVHDEQPFAFEFSACEQTFNCGFGIARIQRRKLVEERRDKRRIQRQHQQLKSNKHQPRIKPPQRPGRAHQPEHQRRERQNQCGGKQATFHQIHPKRRFRRLVEAEFFFDVEGAVVRQGH